STLLVSPECPTPSKFQRRRVLRPCLEKGKRSSLLGTALARSSSTTAGGTCTMPRLASEQHYPTDLTDARWDLIREDLTTHTGPGRPTTVDLRRIVNALLYLTRTGCQWRLIPLDFGFWGTTRYHYDKWVADGTWVRLNDRLRALDRQKA